MWFQLIHISCWLLLCNADTESDISDMEKMLIDENTKASLLENFRLCDHKSGDEARCVKKSLCDLPPEPVKPTTKFTYRELVEGGCTYLQVCCPEDNIRTETRAPRVATPLGCGYSNPGANILRELADQYGYADYGDFPWMVALMKKNVPKKKFHDAYIGGGTLIHPSVVLTVAHKMDKISASELMCRAGEWDTNTEDELYKHQDRDVNRIVVNSAFDMENAYNDVALLILKKPFDLDGAPHIGVACLAQSLPPPGTECYSMGWGKDFVNGDRYASILKKLRLPMYDPNSCQKVYRTNMNDKSYTLHKSLTCAGGKANVDTCIGDGGSSLVCPLADKSGLRYSVVGMVVYGLDCGTENLPGVYAKIPEMYDWVVSEMTRQGFTEKTFVN